MEEFNNQTEKSFNEIIYQRKTNKTFLKELSAPFVELQDKISEILNFSDIIINGSLSKKMEMFIMEEDNRYQKITNEDISNEILTMLDSAKENIQQNLKIAIESIQDKLADDVCIFIPITSSNNNIISDEIVVENKYEISENIQVIDKDHISEIQNKEDISAEEENLQISDVIDTDYISEKINRNLDWGSTKTKDAIRNIIEIINEKLAELDEIVIEDFGVFSTEKENEYISRDKETKEAYLNPPRIHPVFKKS